MLVAAAVCPHPPLLVPDVAAGAAHELGALRTACDTALGRILAARPDLVVLVGAGEPEGERAADAWGTLAPYGVDVAAGLRAQRAARPTLPLSLTIGAWLLNRMSWAGPVTAWAVPGHTAAESCAALGASLADRAPRVGLVAMGDGSARRSLGAPGYIDPRAAGFDEAVATALRDGDADALLKVPADLAAELMAAGRAAWQVLAGAARGGTRRAELCYHDAPYGVGYLVASWVERPVGSTD